MDLIAVVIWVIIICAAAAGCLWIATFAPADFQRPIRIIIIAVAAIFLVYLLGGLLVKLAPPFPGVLGL